MNSKNGKFSWMRWLVGGAGLLILISAGLELFVLQRLGHHSVATVVLALSLAFWSYLLGLGALLLYAVGWLVEWRRARAIQMAMSRAASGGPRSQHLAKPESRELRQNSTIGHSACSS